MKCNQVIYIFKTIERIIINNNPFGISRLFSHALLFSHLDGLGYFSDISNANRKNLIDPVFK